mgnify:CR=1 FL=1
MDCVSLIKLHQFHASERKKKEVEDEDEEGKGKKTDREGLKSTIWWPLARHTIVSRSLLFRLFLPHQHNVYLIFVKGQGLILGQKHPKR